MKNKCNVAKDLMPLCIDGVASEESQQYVDDHIAECTECADVYDEMKVELIRAGVEKENQEMDRVARKMRSKRILRNTVTAVLAIVLLVGVAFAWDEIDYRLTEELSQVMSLDEYTVSLVQTKLGDGIIAVNLKDDEKRTANVEITYSRKNWNSDGKNRIEVKVLTTTIPQYLDGDEANILKMLRIKFEGTIINGEWSDKQPWRNPYMDDPCGEQEYSVWDEIVLISDNEQKVIYTKGDKIPLCSAEMEAYCEAYHDKRPAGLSMAEWRVELVKLLDAAPELQ